MTKHSQDGRAPGFPRRAFLGGSILGGLGLAIGLDHNVEAADEPNAACLPFAAADMLALFSLLAWKLPMKLQKAEEAKVVEMKLYETFDSHYQKLAKAAKQLKLKCAKLSQDDARKLAADELAELTEKNVRTPRSGGADSDAVYLRVAVMVAENRQLSANANTILSTTEPHEPDNKLICEMLAEIRAMDAIKNPLDKARTDFSTAFTSFTTTLKALQTAIVDASEAAAKAERGAGSKQDAINQIEEAQKILNNIIATSTSERGSMVTPEGLNILLEVPKAILENKITPLQPVTQRTGDGTVQFRTARYDPETAARASRFWMVAEIIQQHVFPSTRSSVYWLAFTCNSILDLYANNPPREAAVRNALQSWPFASSNSKFQLAASKIARLR